MHNKMKTLTNLIKTFSVGGIHPPENKLSANKPIEEIDIPEKVYISLNQNIGAPPVLLVKKGDKVKTGQLIAKGEAFISANIHSSVTGIVEKIEDFTDSSGYKRKTIIISSEKDNWADNINTSEELEKEIKLSKEEIINKIKECGIVGMGGATFPTHIKLSIPKDKTVEYLIINGVECEPYLTSDHRLMLEKSEEIIIGIKILMKALGVSKALIGIELNKKDAIEKLSEIVKTDTNISIYSLKLKYPQGAEKQLIKATTNREVPNGKLPIDIGCVVQNVGTAFAVYQAVQKNIPLIQRVVTVTGKSIKNPSNFLVRIGTPIKYLIEKTGSLPENTGKIINGGPMMGKALNNIDVPVTKGTSGIVVMNNIESKRLSVSNCIRCGKCITVCPMGLEPYLLATVSENQNWEIAELENITSCMECGSCQYTCPSNSPSLDLIRVGKNKVNEIKRNRQN